MTTRPLLTSAAAVLAFACLGDSAVQREGEATDASVPRIEARATVTIIGDGRNGHPEFARAVDATRLSSGAVVIADGMPPVIRPMRRGDVLRIPRHSPSAGGRGIGSPSTREMAVMVFQLRLVTGTPKSRSSWPR